MRAKMRKKVFTSILMTLWVTLAHGYPDGAVTIVVPFPPGQTGDIIARTLAVELGKRYGKPFVVDNRPGAGGQIGTAYAARAKNDGSVLLMTSSGPFSIAPALYQGTLPYQPLRDFVGVVETATTPQVLAVSNESGIKSIEELIKVAKAKEITYASAGNGSTQHLSMELVKQQLGIPMLHIPFKGSSESKTQVMSGLIPVTSDSLPAILPQIKSGQLRAIAVLDTIRSPYLPVVPTLAEQGYPKFTTLAFFGLVAPKGTPKAIVDSLNKSVIEIIKTPEIQDKYKDLALTNSIDKNPEQFNHYLASETAKWAKVAALAGAKGD